jgi:hypothetical protein
VSSALGAPAPRLAEILRRYAPAVLCAEAARVVRDLIACRTPLLGGRREACDHCGDVREIYDSCGNRHCPNCQALAQERWLQRQQADLLPVPYFHLVFTVPAVLHPLFLGARRAAFAALFAAVAETLLEVASRGLNATPGVLAVLHTWNQVLGFHPHVHCLVSGGGLRLDHAAWVATRQNFLLPARILRPVFEAKLRQKLSQAAEQGRLAHSLATTRRLLWLSKRTKWRIYAKAPFAGPEQVLRYLGRYTHRIAISNARILALQNDRVTFAYRDRKRGNARAKLSLEAPEFVRRFLRHVVPKRFVRVRHYGVLANPRKAELVPLCRRLLETSPLIGRPVESWQELIRRLTGVDPERCSRCGHGRYVIVLDLPPLPPPQVYRPALHS